MSDEIQEVVLADAVSDEVVTQEEVNEAKADDLTVNIEETEEVSE